MSSLIEMIIIFVDAIALLIAVVFAVSLLYRKSGEPLHSKALMGAAFSFALVMSMSDPIVLPNDAGIFDMRALLVGTAAAILGPIVGLITLVSGLVYRGYIGGQGVLPAYVGMGAVFVFGCIWHYFIKNLSWRKWQKSLVLGALLSSQTLAFLVTPVAVRADLVEQLLPYMISSSFLGALLINSLLTGEFSFISEAQASRINANTDHLTGLLNRRGLDVAYPQLVSRPEKRAGQALLYFDVDRFKKTNDTYGHAVGDRLLKHVVNLIAANLRMDDVFVRLGGDEFAVVLPNIDALEAEVIAERCRAVVADAGFEVGHEAVPVTISVGAIWTYTPIEVTKLLAAADRALYQAKSKGRNAVVFLANLKNGLSDGYGASPQRVA